MLRISQVKLRPGHSRDELKKKIADILRLREQEIVTFELVRQSIDARKKPDVFCIYTVDVKVEQEEKVLKKLRGNRNVERMIPQQYRFPASGSKYQKHPTVIIGSGPAGLFCAYYLALHGYCPLLLERGKCVEERQQDVERFWQKGILDPTSNVQFGEGGAGTFSDGKLNTLVKEKEGRNRAVLETFVKFGAEESILYDAKPHIGTDVLCGVVRNMREEILRLGGEIRFESCVTALELDEQRKVQAVIVNKQYRIECEQVVLACGHSARDTFEMLLERKVPMEAKSFAVGFRVQHLQRRINQAQYGTEDGSVLGAAPYKVTAKTSCGRGVYSFCMCPGGYVVNASSEENRLAVNGMSYSGRDGENANSAIIVSVTPDDYENDTPLAGVMFQRKLEEKAYRRGAGNIPLQRYGAFRKEVLGTGDEDESTKEQASVLQPACKGNYRWTSLAGILPEECERAFLEGMEVFARQIPGFDEEDTILAAVESRTSSPVRIIRDETLQSEVRGLYPCGEGAGYAGGITSAAMDGMRVAEAIASEYATFSKDNRHIAKD